MLGDCSVLCSRNRVGIESSCCKLPCVGFHHWGPEIWESRNPGSLISISGCPSQAGRCCHSFILLPCASDQASPQVPLLHNPSSNTIPCLLFTFWRNTSLPPPKDPAAQAMGMGMGKHPFLRCITWCRKSISELCLPYAKGLRRVPFLPPLCPLPNGQPLAGKLLLLKSLWCLACGT